MTEVAFTPAEAVTIATEIWENRWIVEVVRDARGRFITWHKVGELPVLPPPLKRYRARFDIRWDYPK